VRLIKKVFVYAIAIVFAQKIADDIWWEQFWKDIKKRLTRKTFITKNYQYLPNW